MNNNRILAICDLSNFMYMTIFGAVKSWTEKYDDGKHLKPADEVDQNDLPDILTSSNFKKELHLYVQKRLHTLDWIITSHHQDMVDMCSGIDLVFTVDDMLSNNFRKKKYAFYKAQRKLVPRQFNINKVKDYIKNVIFKELDVEKEYGYKIIAVPNCESDDIIAVMMEHFTDYALRILISSDRDFLQLDNVCQYDLSGNPVKRIIKDTDDVELSTKDFLLWKILRGDTSDNIPNTFPRYGEKKCWKLLKDRDTLKKMLKDSKAAADQFAINKFLIDFSNIPATLKDTIIETAEQKLKENAKSVITERDIALDNFMAL